MQRSKIALLMGMAIAGVVLADDAAVPSKSGQNQPGMVAENAGLLRASKLLDSQVYGQHDKRIGSIEDIVLASDPTIIRYAVVSYSGISGTGGKYYMVPQGQLQYSNSRLMLPLDVQVLKNAPGFDKGNWQNEASAESLQRLDQYYGVQASAKMPSEGGDMTARPAAAEMEHGIGWDHRLTKLIGAGVEQPDGKKLGEIKDVVVDWSGGSVKYAVLTYGGTLGMGEKYFAVPITSLKARAGSDKLILNTSSDQLDKASGFDKDHWPSAPDPMWATAMPMMHEEGKAKTDKDMTTP
jgi:sporulation protein YlmC with PRC-barrel domain